ncbi:hypothetical protein LshimejAT787_0400070 [Lyophyllum shimeji]|uniref:Uncharacterized protein n=1 Tax=Lyophyllum shimeji TaxID=47721 RepID=A0A9P3UN41_LYOSH|nr:hypothetical protein LshimejAT787_0400070 [Lyophyllum shimeji]
MIRSLKSPHRPPTGSYLRDSSAATPLTPATVANGDNRAGLNTERCRIITTISCGDRARTTASKCCTVCNDALHACAERYARGATDVNPGPTAIDISWSARHSSPRKRRPPYPHPHRSAEREAITRHRIRIRSTRRDPPELRERDFAEALAIELARRAHAQRINYEQLAAAAKESQGITKMQQALEAHRPKLSGKEKGLANSNLYETTSDLHKVNVALLW